MGHTPIVADKNNYGENEGAEGQFFATGMESDAERSWRQVQDEVWQQYLQSTTTSMSASPPSGNSLLYDPPSDTHAISEPPRQYDSEMSSPPSHRLKAPTPGPFGNVQQYSMSPNVSFGTDFLRHPDAGTKAHITYQHSRHHPGAMHTHTPSEGLYQQSHNQRPPVSRFPPVSWLQYSMKGPATEKWSIRPEVDDHKRVHKPTKQCPLMEGSSRSRASADSVQERTAQCLLALSSAR